MTKHQLISDIKLRLTKGSPNDELELEDQQIAFWATHHRNEVVRRYLESLIDSKLAVDPYYIIPETHNILKTEADPIFNPDSVYISVDCPIMELTGDRGIVRLLSDEKEILYKTNIQDVDYISLLEWAAPSETNLIYTKVNPRKIEIKGVPANEVATRKYKIWYVPYVDIMALKENDDIILDPTLAAEVLDLIVKNAAEQLFGGFEDTESNSSQEADVQ